jgi:hypothetical protein
MMAVLRRGCGPLFDTASLTQAQVSPVAEAEAMGVTATR